MHRYLLYGVLIGLALAGPASADHHERGVTLYRDSNFGGASQTFYDGDEIPRFGSGAIGNDSASSLRVDFGCQVTLYEHVDFRGAAVTLGEDVPDLGRSGIGNDRASSLQVECRRRFSGNRGFSDRGVTLYADGDYRGREEVFEDDDPDLADNQIRRGTVSSVRVPEGCEAMLYDEPYYRGNALRLGEDVSNMRSTRIGNDRVASLKVECRGRRAGSYRPGGYRDDRPGSSGLKVTLYADDDYRGREEVFEDDDPDLSDNYLRPGTVSSARVPDGCEAVLYDGPYYRGNAFRLTEDVPDLRYTRFGNDRVASLKVECRFRPGWYGGGGSERPGWYRGDEHDEDDHGAWSGRRGAALYQDTQYKGAAETFLDDDPQLGNNSIRADRVSSVRVAPGCIVTIYEHPNYEGRSATLREDTPDLGSSWVGNDSASSIRVDCRGAGRRR